MAHDHDVFSPLTMLREIAPFGPCRLYFLLGPPLQKCRGVFYEVM